jgi:hypothetical protein
VRVVIRAKGLILTLSVVGGVIGLFALGAIGGSGPAGSRAVAAVIGVGLIVGAVRIARCGLRLEPYDVTVQGLTSTDRFSRAEVLGLATQPVGLGRFRRLVVVCADGRVVPAVWTVGRTDDQEWLNRAVAAAYGFGPTQPEVAEKLRATGRLAAAGPMPEAARPMPEAMPDPGLTPATVAPVDDSAPAGRWLGWETIFVVTAFALPGVASAVSILAQHVGGVSNLNEFDLPLPHRPGVSLVLLILGYATTALVVPIALLLLARTGQPPARLGLTRAGFRRDAASAVGILAGVAVINIVVALAFSPLINNKHLTNTATNSHVPAYYIVYALFVSAVTAINEEVLVNGYFLTRLSQRGWSPWRALALSLAVRTSYHAYYGVGLLLTLPLGYLVTRSFQKRQRLGRPILVHFINDAVLLSIAVLTS